MKCYYNGCSRRGNQKWGNWTVINNIEDAIVRYCRKGFKNKYKDFWIDPIYFDDKYFRFTEYFFSEVGIELYPKLTDLHKAFKRAGYPYPKTRDEWDTHRDFVWNIIHKDIEENRLNGVVPINIVVTGVRIPKDGKHIEKYTNIKRVKCLD